MTEIFLISHKTLKDQPINQNILNSFTNNNRKMTAFKFEIHVIQKMKTFYENKNT